MLNVTSFNIGEITSKVSLNTPSSGIIQRSSVRIWHSQQIFKFLSMNYQYFGLFLDEPTRPKEERCFRPDRKS